MRKKLAYQFNVSLLGTEPLIWRRIQVPGNYSFWDLHVAIQDSMGWFDYHLHCFRFQISRREVIEIGIPDKEFEEDNILPGWEIPIEDYFIDPGEETLYEYDFGDSWAHGVLLEGIFLKEKGMRYPRCVDGAGACPPEDCGGVPGFYRILDILKEPSHEEYQFTVQWLKEHVKNYFPFDAEAFDATKIKFDNPGKRWKNAFS